MHLHRHSVFPPLNLISYSAHAPDSIAALPKGSPTALPGSRRSVRPIVLGLPLQGAIAQTPCHNRSRAAGTEGMARLVRTKLYSLLKRSSVVTLTEATLLSRVWDCGSDAAQRRSLRSSMLCGMCRLRMGPHPRDGSHVREKGMTGSTRPRRVDWLLGHGARTSSDLVSTVDRYAPASSLGDCTLFTRHYEAERPSI